jgi:hypothetical protein
MLLTLMGAGLVLLTPRQRGAPYRPGNGPRL